MDSSLFTDRVWAGRAPLIVLLNVGRSSRMCLFCVRVCVSGRGRSCCSRHTQYTCQHQSGVANLNSRDPHTDENAERSFKCLLTRNNDLIVSS